MMNWLWLWVRKKLNNVSDTIENAGRIPQGIVSTREVESEKTLEFTMMFAEGGCVLQKRQYDPIKDRSYRKLYLISEDADVAAKVGEIVAMEMLRL